jgi:CMP-N,N'-diacetyllegionaminic acid synthase
MKVVAIIPARGGSKGLIGKNIKTLCGKPLILWTLEAALDSKFIDDIIVSTDDINIRDIVNKVSFICPSLRPPSLALDTTTSFDVIKYELLNKSEYDVICMLQPTSPIRNSHDIDKAFELFYNYNASSCVSVYKIDDVPYWTFKINSSGLLDPLFSKNYFSKRRQDLDDVYALNGAIYISNFKDYFVNKGFISNKTIPYCMSVERSVDIDTLKDFEEAENYLKLNIK